MNWKDEAKILYVTGIKITEIAEKLEHYFPELTKAQAYNRVRSYLYETSKRSTQKPKVNAPENHTTVKHNEDGTEEYSRVIALKESTEITPDVILEAHGLSKEKWDVVNYTNNFWNSQMKGGYKLMMYQSKIVVRPKVQPIDLEYIRTYFENLSIGYARDPVQVPVRFSNCSRQAEINISDLHMGRLCREANGLAPYNSEIAESVWKEIIREIYSELEEKPVNRIVFVWCNDFFNIDNSYATTVKGTQMISDLDYKLLLATGSKLIIWAIEYLLHLGVPIHTFYTPSNHDGNMSFAATLIVKAWFKDEPAVTVDDNPTTRKYIRYGNTLVGYGHGSTEDSKGTKYKASTLASCMPIESPMWSHVKYREFHAAHLHSEQMIKEINGVIVRRISSPASYDTWHDEKGLVGAVRKAQTFIYDDEDGLCHIIMTPIR